MTENIISLHSHGYYMILYTDDAQETKKKKKSQLNPLDTDTLFLLENSGLNKCLGLTW